MNKKIFTVLRAAMPLLAVLALALVVSLSYITANAGTAQVTAASDQVCAPCDPSDCPVPCTGPCSESTPKCCVEVTKTVSSEQAATSCEPCPGPCGSSKASSCATVAQAK